MVDPALRPAERQCGFALLIVLWTLVLISFLILHLTATGRTEVRIAANLAANAAAQGAAEGAVYQAIFNLTGPQPRWPLDGAVREITIGRSRVMLRLENEAAWLNPNLASPDLVAAALRVLGSDPEQAAILVEAIAEWVGKPVGPRPQQSSEQVARSAYHPPRSPLESLDELMRVRGMTADLYAVLRPHLTLFGPAEPDPAAADPVVAAALALRGEAIGDAPAKSGSLTARIHVTADGPANAVVTILAIARIDRRLPNGYALLAWERGEE